MSAAGLLGPYLVAFVLSKRKPRGPKSKSEEKEVEVDKVVRQSSNENELAQAIGRFKVNKNDFAF